MYHICSYSGLTYSGSNKRYLVMVSVILWQRWSRRNELCLLVRLKLQLRLPRSIGVLSMIAALRMFKVFYKHLITAAFDSKPGISHPSASCKACENDIQTIFKSQNCKKG